MPTWVWYHIHTQASPHLPAWESRAEGRTISSGGSLSCPPPSLSLLRNLPSISWPCGHPVGIHWKPVQQPALQICVSSGTIITTLQVRSFLKDPLAHDAIRSMAKISMEVGRQSPCSCSRTPGTPEPKTERSWIYLVHIKKEMAWFNKKKHVKWDYGCPSSRR